VCCQVASKDDGLKGLRGDAGPSDCYLSDLHAQLKKLVDSRPAFRPKVQEDEAEDPKVG